MNKRLILKTVDNFNISAIHTISEGKGLVLWLHGIAVDKDEYQGFFAEGAQYLARGGLDSLRIDFRGHGASSGSSLDFSVVGQMLDVQAAIRYVTSYYGRTSRFSIVGCSFGAPPAIFAAAQYNSQIKSISLIAPVMSYKRTFLKPETAWAKSLFNSKTFSQLERTNKLYINPTFPITSRLVEEMRIISPEDAMRDLRKKAVIIHGETDSMVPFSVSKDTAKRLPMIRLIPFPGMDHGFMDSEDETGTNQRSIENKSRIFEIIQDQCL